MPPTTSISFEQLSKYFHLPINDVAKELGICATMLKKICRRNGIPRWPHRKIKSLNKMIENLEASLQNNTSEAEDCIKQEISILRNKKTLIMKNPSVLVSGGTSKRLSSQPLEIEKPVKKVKHDDSEPLMMTKVPSNTPSSSSSSSSSSLSINQLLTSTSSFTPLTSYLDPEEDGGVHSHPSSSSIKGAQGGYAGEGAAQYTTAYGGGGGGGYPHSEYHYKYNTAYQMAHHPPSPPSEYGGGGSGGGSANNAGGGRNNHLMYSMTPHAAYPSHQVEYTLPKMNLSSYSQQNPGKYSPPQGSSSQPGSDSPSLGGGGGGGGNNASGGGGGGGSAYPMSSQDSSPYNQYKPSPLRFTHHPSQFQQQSNMQSPSQLSPHQQGQTPMVLRWVMEYDKLKK